MLDWNEVRTEHLQLSYECLQEAEVLLQAGYFRGCLSRAYYCCFHAMCSCLSEQHIDRRSDHGQIIGSFRRYYIKTGIFDKQMSKTIDTLYNNRGGSDYNTKYHVDEETAVKYIDYTKSFYEEIRRYIAAKYGGK